MLYVFQDYWGSGGIEAVLLHQGGESPCSARRIPAAMATARLCTLG